MQWVGAIVSNEEFLASFNYGRHMQEFAEPDGELLMLEQSSFIHEKCVEFWTKRSLPKSDLEVLDKS